MSVERRLAQDWCVAIIDSVVAAVRDEEDLKAVKNQQTNLRVMLWVWAERQTVCHSKQMMQDERCEVDVEAFEM